MTNINKLDAPLYIDVHCHICEKPMALSNAHQEDGRYYCREHSSQSIIDKQMNQEIAIAEHAAADWIRQRFGLDNISPLGEAVSTFLDKMWGLHHLSATSLSKVDWSNNTWIEIVIDKRMATVDNNDLTRLVVIAHQMMLRVDLKGVGPGYVKLMFHQRTKREKVNGNMWDWCPYIQDHVEMITKHHPEVEIDCNRGTG